MIHGYKPFLSVIGTVLSIWSGLSYAQSLDEDIRPMDHKADALEMPTVEYNLPKQKLTPEVVFSTIAADLSLYRGHPKDAYELYTLLARRTKDPRYAELAYKVALAWQNQGAAISAAALLKELAPNAIVGQSLLNTAKILDAYGLVDQQQYRTAYEAAKALLAQNPKNTAALSLLTDVADRLGYDEEALQSAEYWVELEPGNAEALNSLGYFLANKNIRLSEAEKLINKANAIKPNAPHIMDSMGWLAYRQGRLDDALPLLKQASIMEPHEDVLTHLGEVMWQKGQRDAALGAFSKAYQTNAYSFTLRDTLERLNIPLRDISKVPKVNGTPIKKGVK